jgi:hypothetical protein
MSKKDTLRQILGSDTTDKSVHAQALLELLKTATDQNEAIELLSLALKERDSITKRPEALQNKGITQEAWEEIARTHSSLMHEYLTTSFFKSNNVGEFAKRILDFLTVFSSDNEKTYVLASAMFSPFVPYRELPGTMRRMTQHEFDHILASNQEKAALIQYITQLPFSTTVELGSMVLQVLNDTKEKDLQLTLIAHVLNIYREKIADAVRGREE